MLFELELVLKGTSGVAVDVEELWTRRATAKRRKSSENCWTKMLLCFAVCVFWNLGKGKVSEDEVEYVLKVTIFEDSFCR
jgi:hypothetical protein